MNRKLELLNAIEARLKEIKVENNYNTDVGKNVFYWHDLPFEYGEAGAITYRDPNAESAENNLYQEYSLTIEIEAIAFATNLLITGSQLESDLIKSIKSDASWGSLALFTRLLTVEKEIETNGQKAIRLLITLLIGYRNELWSDE